ncbi:MAG TPA: sugar phosphate isomerase/epimerase, partial [Chitinophagaceae bacterium]|nr:sugar phosphate isomerase/epimerase [Chitinophagaceae bacterium]
MNTSRRSFLKNSALTLAGTALLPKTFFAAPVAPAIVGVQLYSVRDDMKKAPLQTLQALSKMGYKYVEHASYEDRKFYGWSATDFKKVLDDLGMHMPSGHTVMRQEHWDAATNTFTKSWVETVEDAATVGQEYVISPWLDEALRKSSDELKRFMDVFNKSGALCKEHGMKFGYHNHNFEFSTIMDGKPMYDIILENTDPELVIHQMDMGNMYGAGGRGLDFITRYPGRFQSLHVKDEIKSAKGEMEEPFESTILGKGLINVKEVLDLAKKTGGTKHYIIEQESYQGKKPLDCMK